MAARETATLTTVARDVKEVKNLVLSQAKTIKANSQDITELQNWKRGLDIAKQAVDEYKRQEVSERTTKSKETILNNLKDLMPYITLLVAAAAIILYAHASTK